MNKKSVPVYLCIPFAFLCAFFGAMYLRFAPEALTRAVLFVLLLLSCRSLLSAQKEKVLPHPRRALILTGVYALLLSTCMVLGYHIHIESAYSGLMDKNYITPYTVKDIPAFIFCFAGIWVLALALVRRSAGGRPFRAGAGSAAQITAAQETEKVPQAETKTAPARRDRSLLISAALMTAAWVPYLLIYWPGFLFADTLTSLQQALGMNVLDNHHPVLYTLFLRFCLFLGRSLGGGNTLGCVIYCILQMIFLAFAFSLMIAKVQERAGIKPVWRIILGCVFALTPYIATYSIAIWKDPVFSASLMLLSIKFLELTDGSAKDAGWWAGTAALVFLTIFSRNNGIYIILFADAAMLLVLLLAGKRLRPARPGMMVLLLSGMLAAGAIVTGPVYRAFGIESPKIESYGIFFNQMARVAAGGGEMSDEDRAYMDSVLELDLYPETYRPCCIDQLKWNQNFHSAPLEQDFFKHWFSMLARNPRIFFEAWELSSCGFWTVNVPAVNQYARNIGGGSPRNFSEDFKPLLDSMDLHPANLLGSPVWKELFPLNDWGVPVGIIAWAVLLLAVCLLVRGEALSLFALAPSAGLMITLIIASPIWYWPRYGAAVQFLIPFYLMLMFPARGRRAAS